MQTKRIPPSSHGFVLYFAVYLFILVWLIPLAHSTWTEKKYLQARDALATADHSTFFDVNQPSLSNKEQHVQHLLKTMVAEETARMNTYTHGKFYLSTPFYQVKDIIESESKLLPFIFDIPKGGILHLHLDSFGDMEWFVRNVTYDDNCYIYFTDKENSATLNGTMRMVGPSSKVPSGFQKVNVLRHNYPFGVKAFDKALVDLLSLDVETGNPAQAADEVWQHFENCILRVDSAVYSLDVYKRYLVHNFEAAVEKDNLQFLELRESLTPLYDLEGRQYNISKKIEVFIEAVKTVQLKYPYFNARLILFAVKSESREVVRTKAWTTLEMMNKYPMWVMGFDLVGEEDTTHPIEYYLSDLIETSNAGLKFWFHAGESNNYTNSNLYDAILLESERIGHGFISDRHPELMKVESQRKIALEVCPLSNKILGLVEDIRDHPFGAFAHNPLQPTINSDDPGVFGYSFVSWDWYTVIVSFGLDLRSIKQLAQNSILYSDMSESKKYDALNLWSKQWDAFIDKYSKY